MVPDYTRKKNQYIVILKSLDTVLNKLQELSLKKQCLILSQDWQTLQGLVSEQVELNLHIDDITKNLNQDYYKEFKDKSISDNDIEIKTYKEVLKNKTLKFKESELINKKLIKDAFYVAKNKAKNYFKTNDSKKTYSNDNKNIDSNIWGDKPVVFDGMI